MCTNFKYPTATDGTVCVGRTMEFPNLIPWELGVLAVKQDAQSEVVPNGMKWNSKYGSLVSRLLAIHNGTPTL